MRIYNKITTALKQSPYGFIAGGGLIKIQLSDKFFRLKIGCYNFYIAHHAMQPIKFEKRQRMKKRRRLRHDALERANNRCEICGCELDFKTISVHHILPRLTHPDKEFEIDNVQALCQTCHARLHEIERLTNMGVCPITE